MFGIGDFARHGRVSVRMLRHYDAVGLLRPARVDPASGYRFYEAAQLSRLNRIIALKELGFTLSQVGSILDEQVGTEELRGMLRLRRAELEEARSAAEARLAQVEARLRGIESEGLMSEYDVVLKALPAVRLAELSGTAPGFAPEEIGPVIRPLYRELCRRLDEAGVVPDGPGLAYYRAAPEGGGAVVVHAGLPVPAGARVGGGVALVHLPAVERAATLVHKGPMDDVLPASQALAHWIEESGREPVGDWRELNLEVPEDPAGWVTELQQPVS
ncbi:MerR family transcriptional regulator [Nocardiopsis potens]|uniref:MerR family transcriptional regulator n=1 Tax=Nocardiopsis potens TaxID=1246458 RepID=UPI0003496A30|nr:MerR family transcriptional regulator [Nocardiopsis potens]